MAETRDEPAELLRQLKERWNPLPRGTYKHKRRSTPTVRALLTALMNALEEGHARAGFTASEAADRIVERLVFGLDSRDFAQLRGMPRFRHLARLSAVACIARFNNQPHPQQQLTPPPTQITKSVT